MYRMIITAALWLWLSPFCFSQNLDDLLGAYFSKSGGIQALEKIHSMKSELLIWQNENTLGVKPVIGNATPNHHTVFKMAPVFEKGVIVQADGRILTKYFASDIGAAAVINGEYFEIPIKTNSYVVLAPVFSLLELYQKDQLNYCGEEQFDSLQCLVVCGPNFSGSDLGLRYYFDKDTKLLIGQLDSKKPWIRTFYSEYKNVDGILLPFFKKSTDRDILFFKEELLEIQLNVKTDSSDFYFERN